VHDLISGVVFVRGVFTDAILQRACALCKYTAR